MNVLVITGPLWPRIGNNANLMSKLLPTLLRNHSIHILSPAFEAVVNELPETFFDVPVHWVIDSDSGLRRKIWYPVRSRITAEPGYFGELGAELLYSAAKSLRRTFPYDAVLCTMQPYIALLAASRLSGVRKVVYLMDPPDFVLEEVSWERGQRQMIPALKKMDAILTTPFILDAFESKGFNAARERTSVVSFPHIERNKLQWTEQDIHLDSSKINLLYSGALFPSVRDPGFFLRILERLDDRFCVTFMGRNCIQFWKENAIKTQATIQVFPEQPYQVALNAMNSADILINVGNNMHIHMPSKTLDYINTGKPIINIYKFPDCPTLYYTKRYPLCLNLLESKYSEDQAAALFIHFCEDNRGKQVPRSIIEETYADSTPEVIASAVLEAIETG